MKARSKRRRGYRVSEAEEVRRAKVSQEGGGPRVVSSLVHHRGSALDGQSNDIKTFCSRGGEEGLDAFCLASGRRTLGPHSAFVVEIKSRHPGFRDSQERSAVKTRNNLLRRKLNFRGTARGGVSLTDLPTAPPSPAAHTPR